MKNLSITLLLAFCASFVQGQDFTEKLAQSEMNNFSRLRAYGEQSLSSNNYDVNFYRCEWTVDPAVRFISGSVTCYFTMTVAGNNIILDMHNSLTVDSVVQRGKKIGFTRAGNHSLQVDFPSALNTNQKDSITIHYKGIPTSVGFGSFNMTTHSGVPVMWTLSEPYGASTWWPCKDALTDKADSIDIIVTSPVTYTSSSNGLPIREVISGGSKTTYWKHRYPISTYLVAIAVTDYVIDNDAVQLSGKTMPVVMYSYPEHFAIFKTATSVAKFCLQGFSALFNEYPFSKERYAQTQFGWGGGMEHQTNSFIVSPNAGLVAHELAHQWFGDKITTASWQDLWLNEGFATYLEFIYTELNNPAGKLAQLQGWTNSITSNPGGSVFIPDTTSVSRMFDSRLTYRKGGYLLHMLRWKLGDTTFFRGVRRYLNDSALAYGNARTADLKRNLETESKLDLSEFFRDWYTGQGYPNYEAVWNQQPNNIVRLQLNQTTSHPSVSFFEMPVPVQFKNATRDTIIRVNHRYNGQMFTVNPGFPADTVIIDPQLWILSKTKTSKKMSSPNVVSDIMVYPNPVLGHFSVAFPNNVNNLRVEIFNSVGQLMYRHTEPANNSSLDLNANYWAAGIYWLRVSGDNFQRSRKFAVLK